jgi:hypothetical protein
VALAAAVVEATRAASGNGTIVAADFPLAFFTVALVTAASALIFMRLPRDAGAALSGHVLAKTPQSAPPNA